MSTQDLASFQADLTEFADKIMPNDHAKFCKIIALEVLQGIIEKTPVDTGLAKGNWQVTTGNPAEEIALALDKSGAITLAKGEAEIMAANPMREVIWISNVLPYAAPLENGHSKQAPAGMVALTLEVVKAKAAL